MPTDLRLGLGTKLVVWLTVWGVCIIPNGININFSSAISCTLQRDSQGIGFTSEQATGSKGKADALDHRVLNTSNKTLQNLLPVGINATTQPLKISTRLKESFTTTTTAHQQQATFDRSKILAASANPSFTRISWSTVMEPAPVARSEAVGAVVDGKLYLFGGFIKSTVKPFTRPIARSDMYDPANNTWTRLADLPNPLTHAATAVDGRNIYIAGGYPGTSDGGQRFATTAVWRYNVDTNSWLAMPTLPDARGGGALERLDRELHFFGGSDINRADKGSHWVLSLDNLKQGWTSAASLPNPTNHLGSAGLGGKLYAIGGQRGQDRNLVTQRSVYVWDPAKPNTWTAVASLPRGRSHISAATFVMDGRIIVAGGEISHTASVSDVTAYNPLSNRWTALTPLPTPRHSGVAGDNGEQIFYTTGNYKGFHTTTYKGVPIY